MKLINDEVAIHDKGFQFYLLLCIKSEISDLAKDLLNIEKNIKFHEEVKANKEYTWYNSKHKLSALYEIHEYPRNSKFTLKEINTIYKERKGKYDLLIGIVQEALNDIEHYHGDIEGWKLPDGKTDRNDILIDHSEIEFF